MILYEGSIKYETWSKVLLAFPIVLVIVMGIFFYNFAHFHDGISGEMKYGLFYWNIRLSPDNREQFLDHAIRALSDWQRIHPS